MNRGISTFLLAIAGLIGVSLSTAGAADKFADMHMVGPARPPIGHVRFCVRNPDECVSRGENRIVKLDEQRWMQLLKINHSVNRTVEPVTDIEFYQTEEFWTLPDGYGDCEDYVLLKRRKLLDAGWPSAALLITVVFDENNSGHAILIARTDRGDFVLDNKTPTVDPWYAKPYRFVKRQSEQNPRQWVSIDDRRTLEDGVASIR